MSAVADLVVYCGNPKCPRRVVGLMPQRVDATAVADGQLWLCDTCANVSAPLQPLDVEALPFIPRTESKPPQSRRRPTWWHYYDGCRDAVERLKRFGV